MITLKMTERQFKDFVVAITETEALNAAGVDNWQGCDYAFEDFDERLAENTSYYEKLIIEKD